MGPLIVGAVVFGGAALGGGWFYDQIRREQARPVVAQHWKTARRAVADRLKQPEPLEFGAVWATHSGLVCGVVNGWGSFGGLTGTTPFAVDQNRAIFALDVTPLQFAPYWRACITDQWITIIEGSMETGWCATRRGQERCVVQTS
jgi:hypothetical protein